MSFIVQLPLVSSSRMAIIRRVISTSSSTLHVIPFDDRPGKLFEGLQHCRSVIFLSARDGTNRCELFTTRYQRWHTETGPTLFSQFEFANSSGAILFLDYFQSMRQTMKLPYFARSRRRLRPPLVPSLSTGKHVHLSFIKKLPAIGSRRPLASHTIPRTGLWPRGSRAVRLLQRQ